MAFSPPMERVPEQQRKDWGQGFFKNLYDFGGRAPLLINGAYVLICLQLRFSTISLNRVKCLWKKKKKYQAPRAVSRLGVLLSVGIRYLTCLGIFF